MIGVDTNVLIRYLTRDDERQSKIAHNSLTKECTTEQSAFINRIVQCEVVWVLERAYQYNREQIAHALEMVFRTRQFQVEDRQAALSALRHFRQGKADYADALIGAGNKAAGCHITMTFDKKASRLEMFQPLTSEN